MLSMAEMVVKVRPFLFTSIAMALCYTAYIIYIRLDSWSAYLPTLPFKPTINPFQEHVADV